MMKYTRVCQFCNEEIDRDEKVCPYCHEKERHPFKIALLIILSIGVFVILFLNILSIIVLLPGPEKQPENQASVSLVLEDKYPERNTIFIGEKYSLTPVKKIEGSENG